MTHTELYVLGCVALRRKNSTVSKELHSLKSLEAQHNFSASWKVTGWKFCSREMCSAHYLPNIFDLEPLLLLWEVLTLCGLHALRKHLGRCYLEELASNTLTGSVREFPRYIQTRIPTPHLLYKTGCLWNSSHCNNSFSGRTKNDKGSTSPGPQDTGMDFLMKGFINMLLTCQFLIQYRIRVCPAGWTPQIWSGRGSSINILTSQGSSNLVLCLG